MWFIIIINNVWCLYYLHFPWPFQEKEQIWLQHSAPVLLILTLVLQKCSADALTWLTRAKYHMTYSGSCWDGRGYVLVVVNIWTWTWVQYTYLTFLDRHDEQ